MAKIKELLTYLEAQDPELVVRSGFHKPHSYRGFYKSLGVEPVDNVPVHIMISCLKESIGHRFFGYKGGCYTMGPKSNVYLAYFGREGKELTLNEVRQMVAKGKV